MSNDVRHASKNYKDDNQRWKLIFPVLAGIVGWFGTDWARSNWGSTGTIVWFAVFVALLLVVPRIVASRVKARRETNGAVE